MARKLELSRAEKYVHNFVIDVELDKNVKHAAANIVKEGWLVYKYKKQELKTKVLKHQRRLLQAIHRIRELKNDQRRLMDNSLTLVEMFKNQTFLQTTVENLDKRFKDVEDILLRLESKMK